MSYLSESEVEAIQWHHIRAPYLISGISHGIFSIARHYGGMKYQGCSYTYIPESDECVRDDVLKFVTKLRKPKKVKTAPEADMFDGQAVRL
jgi:hypothetical protein